MNTLPEEVLRQIWRKTYDYVINEIDEKRMTFLHLKHHPIGYYGTLKKIKHYYYESDSDYEEYRYPSKSDSEDE